MARQRTTARNRDDEVERCWKRISENLRLLRRWKREQDLIDEIRNQENKIPSKKPKITSDIKLKKHKITLREKAASTMNPTPVPQLGAHRAKSDETTAEKEDKIRDTPLKSWVEGNVKYQERWIDPDTRLYVKEGTPGAEKVRTKQIVTDKACANYKKCAERWRQDIANWREVLTSEKALATEEERVDDADYIQPANVPESSSDISTEERSEEEEWSPFTDDEETVLPPRASKYRTVTDKPTTEATPPQITCEKMAEDIATETPMEKVRTTKSRSRSPESPKETEVARTPSPSTNADKDSEAVSIDTSAEPLWNEQSRQDENRHLQSQRPKNNIRASSTVQYN